MSTDDATHATEQSVFSTAGLGLVERLRLMREDGAPLPDMVEAAAEIERLRVALAELVACKDLKDKAERGVTVAGDAAKRGMCSSFQEQSSILAEYKRRKPRAWAAARDALKPNVRGETER